MIDKYMKQKKVMVLLIIDRRRAVLLCTCVETGQEKKASMTEKYIYDIRISSPGFPFWA